MLLERARRKRDAEQAFVQDAAHELKTPLAVVAAQAHVLASGDIVLEGTGQELLDKEEVVESFLGTNTKDKKNG